MKQILFFLIAASVVISILLLMGRWLRQLRGLDSTVIFPMGLSLVCFVCQLITLIPTVLLLITEEGLFAPLCFLPFSLLGFLAIVGCTHCRVEWDEEGFTSYGFWNFPRRFSYGDVRFLQGRHKTIRIYVGSRVVSLEEEALNRREFLKQLRSGYRKAHNGAAIPRTPPQGLKLDLFHGHVDNPDEILLGLSLAMLCPLVFAVIVLLATLLEKPPTPQELHWLQSPPEAVSVSGRDLLLEVDGREYRLPGYEKTLAYRPENLRGALTLGYEIRQDDQGMEARTVHSLKAEDGRILVEPESVMRWLWRDNFLAAGILFFCFLCLLGFTLGCIRVGRNPDRYTWRTRRCFFRPGYLHSEILTPNP